MKYVCIDLKGYKAFQFSNIRHLRLETDAIIQVIIGANGSGKSSLLREISPLPANRPDYETDGCKQITLHHEGSEYILTSDFSMRSNSHSFLKDGQELNESGTSGVQEDLVRTHLGYTKAIEDIVTGKHKFSSMPPGMRRTLLMTLNPFQIGFMLDKHKAVVSALKKCKHNLAHLHERKAALEADMLSESVLEELAEERVTVYDELSQLVEYIHRINELLRAHEDTPNDYAVSNLDGINRSLAAIKKHSVAWKNVDRNDPQLLRDTLLKEITELEALLPVWDEQIHQLLEDVNRYTSHLDDLKANDEHSNLTEEITQLSAERDALLGKKSDRLTFPETAMDILPSVLDEIKTLCDQFLGCSISLLSSSALHRKKMWFERRQYDRQKWGHEFDALNAREAELLSSQKVTLDDLPKTNCAKMVCPLYATFILQNDRLNDELSVIKTKQSSLANFIRKLDIYLSGISEQLSSMEGYLPYLRKLSTLLGEHPYLKEPLKGMDLLRVLQQNPLSLYRALEETYYHSQDVYRLKEVEKILAEKYQTQEHLKKMGSGEIQLIESLLKDALDKLKEHTSKKDVTEKKVIHIKQALKHVDDYQKALSYLADQSSGFEEKLAEGRKVYEKKILSDIKKILEEAQAVHVSRIGSIDMTLREQSTLGDLYEKEIVGQISRIEKERSELAQIESALSPNSGIPHRYAVSFLNSLIATINRYVATVFSYAFELHPISESQALDYKFPAQACDVLVPDISTCSEAQKEMIDFAFMLACIKHLKLQDYPISLDEVGRAFDFHHKHQLLNLFNVAIEEGVISSMFLVNHVNEIIGGLPNAEVLVLNELNILLPSTYNTHAMIIKG